MEPRMRWALAVVLLGAAGLAAARTEQALLARAVPAEAVPAEEQGELRMAVGPAAPVHTTPPPRFQVEGVPPTGLRVGEEPPPRPGRLTRNQWAAVGLATATALLVGLELWREQNTA
ncbi:hypothetical protein EPO15_11490 [bacterium]|nr:MAG: hypothetical protein EPO15_11490 [bacterium]